MATPAGMAPGRLALWGLAVVLALLLALRLLRNRRGLLLPWRTPVADVALYAQAGVACRQPLMANLFLFTSRSPLPWPPAQLLAQSVERLCPQRHREALHGLFARAQALCTQRHPLVWSCKATLTGQVRWELYLYGVDPWRGASSQRVGTEFQTCLSPDAFFGALLGAGAAPRVEAQGLCIASVDVHVHPERGVSLSTPVLYAAQRTPVYDLPLEVASRCAQSGAPRSRFFIVDGSPGEVRAALRRMGAGVQDCATALRILARFGSCKSVTLAWKREKRVFSVYPCGVAPSVFAGLLRECGLAGALESCGPASAAFEWDVGVDVDLQSGTPVRVGFAGSL